jgi:hypothetical protein
MLSGEDVESLPTGDSLAAEMMRFLRERDEENENGDGPEGPAS